MLIKVILVFLVAMGALALVGRLRFPGALGWRLGARRSALKPATCRRCGRYLLGGNTCDCGKRG